MTTETQISRPAPFVEDIGKDLSKQVLAQTTVPVVTTGLAGLGTMAQPTQQAFETADQFKQRQDLFQAQQRAALGFDALGITDTMVDNEQWYQYSRGRISIKTNQFS